MTKVQFEHLYITHQKPWLDLARSLVKDEDTAQDVLQSAMAYLMTQPGGLGRIHLTENPVSYIRMRIVWHIKNTIWGLDAPVESKPKMTIALGQLGISLKAADEYDEIEGEIETPQEQGVRAALARLDSVDQDIVFLRVVAGMTFPEIKDVLELTCVWRNVHLRFKAALKVLQLELGNVGISDQTFAGSRRFSKDQTAA
jgi:DNA-directed RNA polymerase specialized sigma24 family protein